VIELENLAAIEFDLFIAVIYGNGRAHSKSDTAFAKSSTNWIRDVVCCQTCRGNLVEQGQKGLKVVAIYQRDLGAICQSPCRSQSAEAGAENDDLWLCNGWGSLFDLDSPKSNL
jgi:hypothetical protein